VARTCLVVVIVVVICTVQSFVVFPLSTLVMPPPALYIPDFLQSQLSSGNDLQTSNLYLQGRNWLTPGLVDEISSLFPTADDVNPSSGARDKDQFAINCLELFPVGRIFASYKQLDQVAKMFLCRAQSKSN
jgi:hypothetical protein